MPTATIDRFAGLSDRAVPVNLTRIENADLRNVELSERNFAGRKGYQRRHTNVLRDSSARFDGYNDYGRLTHIADYDFAGTVTTFKFHVVLRQWPGAEVTVLSRGFGTGASRYLQVSYDPTINTNNGGWRIRSWNLAGAALTTLVINDGTGASGGAPLQTTRVIEVSWAPSILASRVLTASGVELSPIVFAAHTSFPSLTVDWFIGCDTADGTTVPADGSSSFFPGTLAELSFERDAFNTISIFGNELSPAVYNAASTKGYWRMNDGTGAVFRDLAGTNDIRIGAEGPNWITDPALIVGRGGLEFFGEAGFIFASGGQYLTDNLFGNPNRRWAVSCCFVPRLGQGETAVRPQTIFWFGTGLTNPAPLGLVVSSNDLRFYYYDGVNPVYTGGAGLVLSTYANQRIRIVVECYTDGGFEQVRIRARTSSGVIGSAAISTAGITPTGMSSNFSIGTKVSSFNYPFTFHTRSMYGVISEFSVFRDMGAATGPSRFTALTGDPQIAFSTHTASTPGLLVYPSTSIQLFARIGFDDIGSRSLATQTYTGAAGFPGLTANVFPSDDDDGIRWDVGLVDPYDPPEARLLYDYDRVKKDGSVTREVLVVSGTTLYRIDDALNLAVPIAGNLHKDGPVSAVRYNDYVLLACGNNKRPRIFDGQYLDFLGIRPSLAVPYVQTNPAGGFLPAGEYSLFVTFRNATTGRESNPSPAATFSVTGSVSRVDSVQLPISPDPQVNQRRVWMTTAGVLGASSVGTAYLVVTVEDNITINYTQDITQVLIAATTMRRVENEAAPVGSVLAVSKDRVFLSGSPSTPTTVYYSQVNVPWAFDTSINRINTTRDDGDIVVGLTPLADQTLVRMRDSRVALTSTGDVSDPIIKSDLPYGGGDVGLNGALVYEGLVFSVGERDFYAFDGSAPVNLSSPPSVEFPSIEDTFRRKLEPSRRGRACVALHRARNQIYIAISTLGSTRNNAVLVFDYAQRIWSIYDMDMDLVNEIEDENDDPWIYGVAHGYVVKLDTGSWDGHDYPLATVVGTATFGQTDALFDTTKAWTVNQFRGIYVWRYRPSTGVVDRRLIAFNGATSLTLYTPFSTAAAAGDLYFIGGFDVYGVWHWNLGDPMRVKRLRWLRALIESTAAAQISYEFDPDDYARDVTAFAGERGYMNAAAGSSFAESVIGGLGRSFRVRLAFAPNGASASGAVFPARPLPAGVAGMKLHQLALEAEELKAR